MMTTPAVEILRDFYPEAEITYSVETPYKDIVEGSPLFDNILLLPPSQSKKEFLRFLITIRKKKYDLVIDFHGGPKASLITIFSGARLKIGYKIKYKSFIYNIKIPRSPEKGYIHSVKNHVNLVHALNIPKKEIPRLSFPPLQEEDVNNTKLLLKKMGLLEGSYIALHIGAGNEFRFWGEKNLSGLISKITKESRLPVILLGGAEDKPVGKLLLKDNLAQVHSLAGSITLKQLFRIISKAKLYIGPDSGPMHIAASTSTPIVALFGPMIPDIFGPWKANASLLEKNLECRPCRQKKCIHNDFRCLRTITPDEVWAEAKKLISFSEDK